VYQDQTGVAPVTPVRTGILGISKNRKKTGKQQIDKNSPTVGGGGSNKNFCFFFEDRCQITKPEFCVTLIKTRGSAKSDPAKSAQNLYIVNDVYS
jgi:hypothetical protein